MAIFIGIIRMFSKISDAKYPKTSLPPDWTKLSIGLHCSAGIGDCLIAVGGVSRYLKSTYPCDVTAIVPTKCRNLMSLFTSVDATEDTREIHSPSVYSTYDVILSLSTFMVNSRELLKGDYYKLAFNAAKLTNVKPLIGNFNFKRCLSDENIVAIHASASNPIRRWPKSYWESLGIKLVQHGYKLMWLGSKIDIGYTGVNSLKLADVSEELDYQAKELAKATYFIGNDSCFAHIAGILRVPGSVIFTASDPTDVIGQYPTLTPIEAFTKLGLQPSRSLRNNDPNAQRLAEAITVDSVFASIPNNASGKIISSLPIRLDKVPVVGVVGSCDFITETELSKWFKLKFVTNEIPEDVDVLIRFSESSVSAVKGKIDIVVATNDPIALRKQIRSELGRQFPIDFQLGNIAVRRDGGIGDVIMGSSILPKLQEMFPEATIFYDIPYKYRQLVPDSFQFGTNGNVSVNLDYYDCWRNDQSALEAMGGNEFEMMLPNLPSVAVRDKVIGICPRQNKNNPNLVKEWANSNWIELAQLLLSHGFTTVQLGSIFDTLVDPTGTLIKDERSDVEDVIGMLAKLSSVRQLVTIDGFAQHAARALGKRAIVLWGKSASPELIGYPKFHKNIVSKSNHQCVASIDISSFKEVNCCGGDCMNQVTFTEVFYAIMEAINGD